MAKFCKKPIFIVLLALCLIACLALVACNETDPPAEQTVTYTVTVNIDATTPASNVQVVIKKGTAAFETKTTGNDGKVSFELVEDNYDVVLSNLPEHYDVPADTELKLTATNHNLTVTLARKFAYTVTLVNADDTPFTATTGVKVGVCTTSTCYEGVDLGADGVAVIEQTKGNYHVKIYGLTGYAYECDGDGYYTGAEFTTTSDVNTMTIKLYPVLSGVEMTDEEKEASETPIPQEKTAYIFTKTLNAGETVYYAFTADITGEYTIYTDQSSSETFTYSNMHMFEMGNYVGNSFTLNGYTALYTENTPKYTADKTYYYAITNNTQASATATIIVIAPTASYVETEGVGGTINVVATSAEYATIYFTPTQAGFYKFTSQGTTETYIDVKESDNMLKYVMPPYAEVTYEAQNSASIKVTANADGKINPLYIGIAVNSDESTTFNVVINQVNKITNTVNVIEVKETLTTFTKEDNTKLAPVAMDGSAKLVFNETDNFYHLGSEDGPVVVVLITGVNDTSRLDLNEGVILASFETAEPTQPNIATYVIETTSDDDKEDNTKGNTYDDYRLFLRGFKNFTVEEDQSLTKPALETENCYANFVNEDGAYPLTKELEAFLKAFYTANETSLGDKFDWSVEFGCEWMFPLYYYTEAGEDDNTDADVIVGEYKFYSYSRVEDGEPVTESIEDEGITVDTYTLTVYKNGTFEISTLGKLGYTIEYAGDWTNNEGTYTFTVPDGLTNLDYSLSDYNYTVEFNSTTGNLKLSHIGNPENEYDIPRSWEFNKVVANED